MKILDKQKVRTCWFCEQIKLLVKFIWMQPRTTELVKGAGGTLGSDYGKWFLECLADRRWLFWCSRVCKKVLFVARLPSNPVFRNVIGLSLLGKASNKRDYLKTEFLDAQKNYRVTWVAVKLKPCYFIVIPLMIKSKSCDRNYSTMPMWPVGCYGYYSIALHFFTFRKSVAPRSIVSTVQLFLCLKLLKT